MLDAPIAPLLARMGWPSMLMMRVQSSTGLVETWFLAKPGTQVLAGVAVVVPVLMLMQNMSQGAMGDSISSSAARAPGAGNTALANQFARHAVTLSALIGVAFLRSSCRSRDRCSKCSARAARRSTPPRPTGTSCLPDCR